MVELLLALFVDGCKEDFNVLVVTSSCFKFVTFFDPPQPGRDEGDLLREHETERRRVKGLKVDVWEG